MRVVCLRSKSYSIESLSTKIRKSKGVRRYVVKAMSHEKYEKVLLQGEKIH